MILLIDNYDSFVYNLARYFEQIGRNVRVARNDEINISEIAQLKPEALVISPGPCNPARAGISVEVVREFGHTIPLLGVCLGHQCIGEAFGGTVVRALEPMHGRTSQIKHNESGVFAGIPNPFTATRYHSLIVDPANLPDCLEVTAQTEDDVIMAIRHKALPIIGLQFHPESILTEHGYDLLRNFLKIADSFNS
ncbi:MAG: aminodeoxychorismate/anthranilate synthase component II [Planctomycetota bacterium]|nr:aminodeoxychorismate/anthranilate synthase component II [Planctomycetota bacterium]